MSEPEDEVLRAAANLVAAFGAHDVTGYFESFAPDATFLFYTTPRLLRSRAEYEVEWRAWEGTGFHVLGCHSVEPEVHLISDTVAVFVHRVRTRTRDADGEHDLAERESIVFRREARGRWLGVHEHLSTEP